MRQAHERDSEAYTDLIDIDGIGDSMAEDLAQRHCAATGAQVRQEVLHQRGRDMPRAREGRVELLEPTAQMRGLLRSALRE